MEMSLYEYRDLIVSYQDSSIASLTFYVSLISAYVLVAYLVAKKLSLIQVLILSLLFSVGATGAAMMVLGAASEASELMAEADALYGTELSPANARIGLLQIGTVLIAGVGVSLLFMWSSRKKRP